MVLIYAGAPHRVPWDSEKRLPYVTYVDAEGKPQDWMFDSFLWMEFATPDNVHLHRPAPGKRPVTRQDWQWMLDRFFDPEHGVGQIQATINAASAHLGKRPAPASLVLAMPLPFQESGEFGAVEPDGPVLDFRRKEDQSAAVQWYIRSAIQRWHATAAPDVRLAGFYWLKEWLNRGDEELIAKTASFLHSLNLRLYWIPGYGTNGPDRWRELGFDAMMVQPTYYSGKRGADPLPLAMAVRDALIYGGGVEIELDYRAATDPQFRERYLAYLDAGVKYGFMTNAALACYEGGDALLKLSAARDPGVRGLYDALYRFLKGTYHPGGTIALPDLPPARVAQPGNLALASAGARVIGRFAPGKGLEPERLIDGEFRSYSGRRGFAAFTWPGSFIIELPRVRTVAHIETLLYDRDDRAFRYQIEVSVDGTHWALVVDKSQGEHRSWQVDRFRPVRARYLRFRGLHNTAPGRLFQIVEIEVYSQ